MIYDAHAHLGTEAERRIRRQTPVVSMICAQEPKEAAFLLQLVSAEKEAETVKETVKNKKAAEAEGAGGEIEKAEDDDCDCNWIVPTFGLHPWQSAAYSFDDMKPFLEKADIIGEIGMDNVWCDIPLARQQMIFEEQLAFASAHKKPVILHTKGQEMEIAKLIRHYPNRYLVHWYSDLNGLEAYLEQDCYFTLGPDLKKNPAVCQVLEAAPLNRVLVETDGWSAVEWAFEGDCDYPAYFGLQSSDRLSVEALPTILLGNMKEIAAFHKLTLKEVTCILEKTFHSFTKK